jgi:dephospho-CoA kinase
MFRQRSSAYAIMRGMLRVGLTGNIGCGKSTAVAVLAELGAHIIDADVLAREVMRPGSAVYARIVETFGNRILQTDGAIDRKVLGRIIFTIPEQRELLNSLVHPAVRAEVLHRIAELESSRSSGIVVVDAALMVESGFYRIFDRLIVVTCDPALQLARIVKRDAVTSEEARARMEAQMPMEEKLRVADYIIESSGTLRQTKEQIEAVYRDLLLQEIQVRNRPRT